MRFDRPIQPNDGAVGTSGSGLSHRNTGSPTAVPDANTLKAEDILQRQRYLAMRSPEIRHVYEHRVHSAGAKQALKRFVRSERPMTESQTQTLIDQFAMRHWEAVIASCGFELRSRAQGQLLLELRIMEAARQHHIRIPDRQVKRELGRMVRSGGRHAIALGRFLQAWRMVGVRTKTLDDIARALVARRRLRRRGVYVRSAQSESGMAMPWYKAAG